MKTTNKKLEKLEKKLNEINKREEDMFNFSVWCEYDYVYIIDSYEEFYYGGFAFDRMHDELNDIVKTLFGDDCYIECDFPGRWVIGRCQLIGDRNGKKFA